ncbi:MAG: hypothetical protein JNM67_05915 [Bacteroidetes bacterium]|nr:hypothetical protein [Bacteroidota bacterium]
MQNILGISLKVKHLGLAVLYGGELTEFRVRTFYGAWTDEKRNDILRTIKKMIERYEIVKVVVKAPKPTHCSDAILAVLRDIERHTEQSKIEIAFCKMADLNKLFSEDGRGNRRQLIHAICKRYPSNKQLAILCEKERNSKNPYHVKVFEAIACAELGLGTEL